MMRRVVVFAMLAGLAQLGCQKPKFEDCERLCIRFNELSFWERFDQDAEGLTADEKAELRADREKEWEAIRKREHDPGRENCVTACRHNGKMSQVRCVDQAKTAQAARDCVKDD